MNIDYTEFTHKGTREENQDQLLCIVRDENDNTSALFAVIDGMGGLNDGAEAAREVLNSLQMAYSTIEDSSDKLEALQDTLHRANTLLKDSERSNRGATCSALWLENDKYYIAHTGDTRIFRLNKDETTLLTEDQNIAYTMYSMGRKTYEEYLEGGGHNKLLSFIGIGDPIELLGFEGEVQSGDMFLLNSDGLNQFLQLREVEKLGTEATGQDEPYGFVVAGIEKSVVPEESDDNVTWVCVRVE